LELLEEQQIDEIVALQGPSETVIEKEIAGDWQILFFKR
jgi:hypothetical protein